MDWFGWGGTSGVREGDARGMRVVKERHWLVVAWGDIESKLLSLSNGGATLSLCAPPGLKTPDKAATSPPSLQIGARSQNPRYILWRDAMHPPTSCPSVLRCAQGKTPLTNSLESRCSWKSDVRSRARGSWHTSFFASLRATHLPGCKCQTPCEGECSELKPTAHEHLRCSASKRASFRHQSVSGVPG